MAKTQEQKKITNDLAHAVERLQEMTDLLGESQLRARPEDKKWSMKEIVAHLAAFEPVALGRLKAMLTTDGPVIEKYDTDAWAATDHIEEDFDENLQKFIVTRKKTLEFLKRLKDKDWFRAGQHPVHQNYTIQKAAELLAAHDANHLRQIEILKKRFGA